LAALSWSARALLVPPLAIWICSIFSFLFIITHCLASLVFHPCILHQTLNWMFPCMRLIPDSVSVLRFDLEQYVGKIRPLSIPFHIFYLVTMVPNCPFWNTSIPYPMFAFWLVSWIFGIEHSIFIPCYSLENTMVIVVRDK